MFERFTTQARAVVISARLHARALHSERIEPIHVFLGALDKADEPLGSALAEAGFTLDNALEDVLSRDARALRSIGIDLHDVIDTVECAVGFGDVAFQYEQSTLGNPGEIRKKIGKLCVASFSGRVRNRRRSVAVVVIRPKDVFEETLDRAHDVERLFHFGFFDQPVVLTLLN